MKKIKIGIIGLGSIAKNRMIPALKQTPGVSLEAVFDISAASLRDARANLPVPFVTTDEEKFFKMKLDGVYISTSNDFHHVYAIKCVERGIPVLVEKPCADSVVSVEKMLKASRKYNIPIMTAYMSKFNRYNQKALEVVASGKIGNVHGMDASFGFEFTELSNWRFYKKTSGFGVLGDLGIYLVTTGIDIFNEKPISCSAVMFPSGNAKWTDRIAFGRITFSNNRFLQFDASFMHSAAYYSVVGTKGSIHVSNSWNQNGEGTFLMWEGTEKFRKIKEVCVNPYVEELKCFKSVINGARAPAIMGLERSAVDIRTMDAICRSAANQGQETRI